MTFTSDEIQAMNRANGKSKSKGFKPSPKVDRPAATQQPTEENEPLIDSASLALVAAPIANLDTDTAQLADSMIQAAATQANRIAQMVIAYPDLVASMVQASLEQAKSSGNLGRALELPKFTPGLSGRELLQSRLKSYSPKLLSASEVKQ
jgi:hypothetical protein